MKRFTKLFQQALTLRRSERHGSADLHRHFACQRVTQGKIGGPNRTEQIEPFVLVQDHQQIAEQLSHAGQKCVLDNLGPALPAQRTAAQEPGDDRIKRHDVLEEIFQFLTKRFDFVLLRSRLEKRLGINAGRCRRR